VSVNSKSKSPFAPALISSQSETCWIATLSTSFVHAAVQSVMNTQAISKSENKCAQFVDQRCKQRPNNPQPKDNSGKQRMKYEDHHVICRNPYSKTTSTIPKPPGCVPCSTLQSAKPPRTVFPPVPPVPPAKPKQRKLLSPNLSTAFAFPRVVASHKTYLCQVLNRLSFPPPSCRFRLRWDSLKSDLVEGLACELLSKAELCDGPGIREVVLVGFRSSLARSRVWTCELSITERNRSG